MGNGAMVLLFEFEVHFYFPEENKQSLISPVHCFPRNGPRIESKPAPWEDVVYFKK